MTTTQTVKLNTVGVLADKLGQPIHRIQYLLRTRKHIAPVAIAGRSRLYLDKTIAQLRHELNAIDARASHVS